MSSLEQTASIGSLGALILRAQGLFLHQMAEYLGPEVASQILEEAGESTDPDQPHIHVPGLPTLRSILSTQAPPDFEPGDHGAVYLNIESTVRELNLPAMMEFYLWSYPAYRVLAEGSWPLPTPLHTWSRDLLQSVVEEIIQDHAEWLKSLHLPHKPLGTLSQAADPHWRAFRAQAFKDLGFSPLSLSLS